MFLATNDTRHSWLDQLGAIPEQRAPRLCLARGARAALATGLCVALAACGGGFKGGATSGAAGTSFLRKAPESVLAKGTDIQIAGPQGYCVDRTASRVSDGSSFVLLGNCAAIAKSSRAPQPRQRAVLSASVGEAQEGPALSGQIEQLNSFFYSDQGRALIAKSGNAADVQIQDTFFRNDTFFLRARETEGAAPELGPERWRAVMQLNDRLVSLSVMEAADAPMSADGGLSLISEFARNVRNANQPGTATAVAPTPVVAPAPVTTPAPAPTAKPKLRIGLLRKVFG